MIIGVELFYQIIKYGRKVISDNLTLINSVFGFIVSGSINTINHKSNCFLISENTYNCIKKFWGKEETILGKSLSKEEEFCEIHFRNTHRRGCTGRFIVFMPVQDEELPTRGNSLILAQKRLNQTIKKLDRDPYMHRLYSEFLEEYESLGHMQGIPDNCYSPINYYLPHHGVFKSQNNSTKLLVVFDGSAPTTSGRSLNDILSRYKMPVLGQVERGASIDLTWGRFWDKWSVERG
ncbi:integrase catalytic domain-containing protein [Trichonephila clavipes]|nr:integrase catalytic domain-containing protein [Trichonephila clavipes]